MKIYCKDLDEAQEIMRSLRKDGWETDGGGKYVYTWFGWGRKFRFNVFKPKALWETMTNRLTPIRQNAVSGNEANPSENKKDGEVAVCDCIEKRISFWGDRIWCPIHRVYYEKQKYESLLENT